MQAQEIEHYLAELGAALQNQGIIQPIRLMLLGGTYMMLLANAPWATDDVDIFWVEEGEDFQKARQALRDAVQTLAGRYALTPNWLNYLTQMLIYDKIMMPRGKLWRRYGPLHVLELVTRNSDDYRYLLSSASYPFFDGYERMEE